MHHDIDMITYGQFHLSDTSRAYWARTWTVHVTDGDANHYAISPPLNQYIIYSDIFYWLYWFSVALILQAVQLSRHSPVFVQHIALHETVTYSQFV